MNDARARCLLADDHPALVHALAGFLARHGFEIICSAGNAAEAVASAARERPDLALVDYRMPGLRGGELVRRLQAVSPATAIVVYTAAADEAVVEDAFAAGARAIVLKEAPLADVVRALDAVRQGHAYLDPGIGAQSLRIRSDARTALTDREADVLRLLAEGLSHQEVGRRLDISAETARTHLRKACGRLGAPTRTSAVARAIRLGLI